MLFDFLRSKGPAPLRVEDYLDDKNRELYSFVNDSLQLTIKKHYEPDYGIYTIRKEATIYVPDEEPNPASFTHELLHAKLWIKQIYCSPKLSVSGFPKLAEMFSDNLCNHFSNVLEHKLMLPEFLALGYEERAFLADFNVPCLDSETISNLLYGLKSQDSYYAPGVDKFIGYYLAARLNCLSFADYTKELEVLREAEPELTKIIDDLAERWEKYDMANEGNILEDSCMEIVSDFVFTLNDWACDNIS